MRVEDVFLKTIEDNDMLINGDRVVVGVSGGPDSITLLHLLHRYRQLFNIEIMAVHLNHNFRPGAAEKDAEYVRAFCKDIGVPSVIEFCDVPAMSKTEGLSPEQAGRKARYSLFYRVMKEREFNRIAVAHNRDDQAETVLMRLIRGSGVEGLGGIQPVRDCIIRPLIDIPRCDIERYCREHALNPVTDLSNFKPVYTRNKIRLELIPYLKKEFNPAVDRVLIDTASILRSENEFVEQAALDRLADLVVREDKDYLVLDARGLSVLHDALLRRILRMSVKKISGSTNNLSFNHIEAMHNLIKSGVTGTKVDLPGILSASVSYGEFRLSRREQENSCLINRSYVLNIPGITTIGKPGNNIEVAIITVEEYYRIKNRSNDNLVFVDFGKTGKNIVATGRRKGDRFVPLGMRGTKKLKDFFIDNKVPREIRDTVPIIRSSKGIIWVAGFRIDDDYKIGPETSEVLMLKYNQNTLGEE